MQILVSLRLFGTGKSLYINFPFRCCLGLCIKKFTKHYNDSDHKEVSLSLSHAHIGLPQGFNLNVQTSIPVTLKWEFPRGRAGGGGKYEENAADHIIPASYASYIGSSLRVLVLV